MIAFIGGAETVTASELVKYTAMDKGLVSRNVKSLVDGGLVASCTHEVGSLIHLLNLTVAGKQVFDTALPRMRRRQQMLQDTLRRFLRERYDTATRNKILASDTGMSSEIWEQLAELGVIGALFTEEQGGFGGKGFDISVVFEELGRAGVVEPFLDTAVLAGGLVADLGDESQVALVEEIIAGTCQMAFAHGEPTSRYDLNRVQTSAKGMTSF